MLGLVIMAFKLFGAVIDFLHGATVRERADLLGLIIVGIVGLFSA
jgi:hypothetical protein